MAEGGAAELGAQREEIASLLKTPLRKEDTWYLVDSRWFKLWRKYVGFDSWDKHQMGERSVYPGPVDNSGLLKGDGSLLKEHLIDELDYILLPKEGWSKLVTWYGLTVDQEPISRKVIEQGMFVKHCKVEVYLTELKLCENKNMENMVTRRFSKADTIDTIEKEMRKLFGIPDESETRLWNRYMSNTFEPLNKPDSTVQDAGLYQGQVLVIEQKNDDGTWPRGSTDQESSSAVSLSALPKTSPSSLSDSYYGFSNRNIVGYSGYSSSELGDPGCSSQDPGLCGLSNLGNTCFMSSALQCLSNVAPLTEYFLNGKFQEELNTDNPLGMRGEIARAYAELTSQLWSGRYSYVTPRAFKSQVGRFAPQFSGYQQQDSQELLSFLLDGLHEDLNRIRIKPYIQLRDADGRVDKVVAQEAWENHKKRNDSIIVDIFHGLFKSTLVCPVCSKVSVTFDPFCYLTLPLPQKKERSVEVCLVKLDPASKPTRYKLSVPKVGYISELCAALSALSEVPAEKMIVTDVYNHRFHRIFATNENLSCIMERDDIHVFEVEGSGTADSDQVVIPVQLKEKYKQSGFNNTSTPLFGIPFLLSVPRKLSRNKLYNLLLLRMSRYLRTAHEVEEEAKGGGPVQSHVPKENGVNGNIVTNTNANANNNPANRGLQEECTSEMETDNQDEDPSQDQELKSGNNNCQSEESVGGTNSQENGIGPDQMKQRQALARSADGLFSIHFNNMGWNDTTGDHAEFIQFDEAHFRLSERSFISLDWEPDVKQKYFDEQAAEDCGRHESLGMKPQQQTGLHLRDCVHLFTTTEKLGAQDPWYCPSCKQHQQAFKKLDLWSLPAVLVVHLKRFSYSRYIRDKLDSLVDFPLRDLNMSEFLINPEAGPCTYDLIAVSNHYGGLGGGHYTAFAKNKDNGRWYHFDDSSVTSANEDQIVSKAAYVLFYQRRDTCSGAGFSSLDREAFETSAHSVEEEENASQNEEDGDDDGDDYCSDSEEKESHPNDTMNAH